MTAKLPAPGSIEVLHPIALADRARVPEKEPGFASAVAAPGRLAIDHDGSLPSFAEGDVLGGTAGGGYLVRVVRVLSANTTHVELETEPAPLTGLIAEGHFRVHYDALEYQQVLTHHLAELPASAAEGDESVATAAQALQVAAGAHLTLLELAGSDLPGSCGVSADGHAGLDVTAALSPVIDLEIDIGPDGVLHPIPKLKKLRFVSSGELDVTASLHGTGAIDGTCTIDLLELAGGAPSLSLPTLTFWVGPVPIVVTTGIVPTGKAELNLSFTDASVSAEAHTTAALEVGVDYDGEQWSTIWEPSCAATGTASFESQGSIQASGKVRAGAELQARLYGVLGPSLGVEAYARVTAESAAPYCTYDAWSDGGVRAYVKAEAGVSVGPLDLTFASLELAELDLVHVDGPHTSGALRECQ